MHTSWSEKLEKNAVNTLNFKNEFKPQQFRGFLVSTAYNGGRVLHRVSAGIENNVELL